MGNLQFHLEILFEDVAVKVQCIRKDEPENLNGYTLKEWVYRRRKPFYENGGGHNINPATSEYNFLIHGYRLQDIWCEGGVRTHGGL